MITAYTAVQCQKDRTMTDTVFLNNLYELHRLYQQDNFSQCCQHTSELERKVKEQAKTIESLLSIKKEQELQAEKLGQVLFKEEQKLKIMADRVNQLENSNDYRKEVMRLENVVELGEAELKTLKGWFVFICI